MMGENKDLTKNLKGVKTRDERDTKWSKELNELKSKNAIMSNDLMKMRERLKPLSNAGFNYSDRKSAKGTKIWVKDSRPFTD